MFFKKKDKLKVTIPKTAQQTIPFSEIYSNGIIKLNQNEYSLVCSMKNINYILARDEEKNSIFSKYCSILNSLDDKIQITINNTTVNIDDLAEKVLIRNKTNFEELKNEYNEILKEKIYESKNRTAKKELFLTLTTRANNIETAHERLMSMYNNLSAQFKKLGSDIRNLSAEEVIESLYYVLNPKKRELKDFKIDNLFAKGMSVKDLIAPPSFKFKINHFQMGDNLVRCLFVKDLATSLKDTFIHDILELPFSVTVTMHIETIESAKAVDFLRKKLTNLETNKLQYTKRDRFNLNPYIPYELRKAIEETNKLLDELTSKNKKMFDVSIYLAIYADSFEELSERTLKLINTCKRHLVIINALNHQQEEAFASILPIGYNKVGIKRTLLTDSTAIFMPYTMDDILDEDGFYYGINQITKGLIILNRKKLENPAGFILGRPRSGKSFAAKREIINALLSTDDDILVVDPEGEYITLCNNFGGEVIKISTDSENYINPFDISEDYGAGENPVMTKSEFILGFCESLLGSVKAVDKSIIDRCVKLTYSKYESMNIKIEEMPTLKDFYNILVTQPETEAKDIALALELYVNGSLNIFAHRTNVDVKNRFTVFNIRDLGKQLKGIGMLMVLDFIWNRLCTNWEKKKRTWVYIDEFYMFFSHEYVAEFFKEFYKRSQKRGGIPTGITQNVEEILRSETAKLMLANSEFLLIFNQAPTDREELAKLLKLSPYQLSYVVDPEEGSGIMIVKSSVVPFADRFPKDSKLYKMITTKVADLFEEVYN